MHVQKRLDLGDVHDVTQGIERDIIDSLKEMIDALKKARDDNQAEPGKSGPPGQSGKPADPKLLELIQELKMVRALQKRVNDRTEFYAKRFPGQEQAADPNVVRDLRILADRQQRIQDIVSRIAKGDNK
jgi:sugar phosphate isomerase/epimerase